MSCKHVIKLGIVYDFFITYFIAPYSAVGAPSLYMLFHSQKSTEDYIAVYEQENYANPDFTRLTISEHQIITVLIYILCACMFATFHYQHTTFALY